ncbi:glycosyltransferase family 2 protein [Weizmannia sp. CD-2023]|uniref:glycosyltransferase family 2 protein n=1 Tax=Heyndrickxia TaxID=2837504 RepID=UPI002E200C21|nr:glycosyltransferase family 2 protein [Weizmannia sp. CD-2023]MED4900980.1 glycosyltransferase family 2 protein [Weizmannia sp. CD-2023]
MKHLVDSVCAVIVTYNRLSMLKECIESLLMQTYPVDKILIINNNSTDGTYEFLKEAQKKWGVIQAFNLESNIGGAGGFSKGVDIAFKQNYDWVWIMDDDAEPQENCLESLINFKQDTKDTLGFIAPVIINKYSKEIQNYHHKYLNKFLTQDTPVEIDKIKTLDSIEIDANAFVGPLISKKAIQQVGSPRADFFIWLDDTEYTYRISRNMKSYLVSNAIIYHKDNATNNSNDVGNFWKVCYGIRNRYLWIDSSLKGTVKILASLKVLSVILKKYLEIVIKKEWMHNRKLGIRYLARLLLCCLSKKTGKFIIPEEYLSRVKN